MVAEVHPDSYSEFPAPLDKKGWHEYAETIVPIAYANDQPVSVLFIDVNNFKAINDKLGHQAGDRAIAEMLYLIGFVASEINKEADASKQPIIGISSSSADIDPEDAKDKEEGVTVGRVGGDEIAVLAFTDAAGTAEIAERIRLSFASYLRHPSNEFAEIEGGIGIAIGYATRDPRVTEQPADTEGLVSELLSEADHNMYLEKELDKARRKKEKIQRLPELSSEQLEKFTRVLGEIADIGIKRSQVELYAEKYSL